MKCFLSDFPAAGAFELMRWFGYTEHREEDGRLSFVRSSIVSEARFPRFHASVSAHDGGVQVNLHLDQEDSQGHDNHEFVWAYHNLLVLEESQRLQSLMEKARHQVIVSPVFSTPKDQKK
jgi:hypothetical protein